MTSALTPPPTYSTLKHNELRRIHPHSQTTLRPHPGRLPFPQFHTWEGMSAYHKEDPKNLWPGGLPKTNRQLMARPVLTDEEERKVKFYQLRPEKEPPVEVQRNMKKLERWSALCVAPTDIVQNITAADLDPAPFLAKLSKLTPTWDHHRLSPQDRAQNEQILEDHFREMRAQMSIHIVQGDPNSGTYSPPNYPEGAQSYGSYALPGAPGHLAVPITLSTHAIFAHRSLAHDFVMHRNNPHWAIVLEQYKEEDRRAELRREQGMAILADKIRREAAQRQREEAEIKLRERKKKEREETERLQGEYAEKEAKWKKMEAEEAAAEKERKQQEIIAAAKRKKTLDTKERKRKDEEARKRAEEQRKKEKIAAERERQQIRKKQKKEVIKRARPVKKAAPREKAPSGGAKLPLGRVHLVAGDNAAKIRLSQLAKMRFGGKPYAKGPLQPGGGTRPFHDIFDGTN